MAFKILRNDITKMKCQAIVNTANPEPVVGTGCDTAIYNAAGRDELLEYRKKNIGPMETGSAFITPGFNLEAEYIIHAVSPKYTDGQSGEEKKLRSCYQKSLQLALDNGVNSIAFPLISTGGFGYPKEEGMRIAVDEINAFLLSHSMEIYLVVFDTKSTELGEKLYPDLEEYIDQNYVSDKKEEEYGDGFHGTRRGVAASFRDLIGGGSARESRLKSSEMETQLLDEEMSAPISYMPSINEYVAKESATEAPAEEEYMDFEEAHGSKLTERMQHLTDTFSEYLIYLIESKGMTNTEVYKRAIVDRKVFSKIKNNPDYHPQKMTAMCLCIGAKLNLDESRDLLARAGYALSPCEKTDIIFSYFIENEIFDMIELDIQLEEHGLKCLIS